ncbi:hypothetical protein C9975_07035 [Thalassospira xiamenensis]|nr:hypothetical protein C9975_07035 [Thalassospira xiamenensis]
MTLLTQLTQARAQARQAAKALGHLSGLLDFLGLGFLASVVQAFAVAALLLALLLTLLMRQVMQLSARLARQLRQFVVRVVTGGAFWLCVCATLAAQHGEGIDSLYRNPLSIKAETM